jgi:hypothetical protein
MPVHKNVSVSPLMAAQRWRINRKVLAIGVAMVVALGAFLAWGPMGLGNGPVDVDFGNGISMGTDAGMTPVGLTGWVTGPSSWRADSIQFIPPAGYRAPRILAVLAISENLCEGGISWLQRADRRAVLMAKADSCSVRTFGPVIGPTLGSRALRSFGLGTQVPAPPRAGCWAVRTIVIHYHVGIHSYAATDPFAVAVCGARTTQAQLTAAGNAAGGIDS